MDEGASDTDRREPPRPNGAAFGCVDLGGTVAPFGPVTTGVEGCTVKPGTKIFVAAFTVECSTFEGNGTTEAELRTCARESDLQVAPIVKVDDKSVPVAEVETPLLHITLPDDPILPQPAGPEGRPWGRLGRAPTPADAREHTIFIDTDPDKKNPANDITTKINVVQPALESP